MALTVRSWLTVVLLLMVATAPVQAQQFVRGDVNGDGVVDNADTIYLNDYFIGTGPGPLDCTLASALDAGDINDNEWITAADVLYLLDSLFCVAPPLPPPATCGGDPDDNQHGFGRVDPNFQAHLTTTVTASSVSALLEISVPNNVQPKGATIVLRFSATVTPQVPLFTPVAGVNSVYEIVAGDRVIITVRGVSCGSLPAPTPPQNRITLGTVNFSHGGWVSCAPSPLSLEPDATVTGGILHRATIVDDMYADHHPQLMRSACAPPAATFIRGDTNGDGVTNNADAILLLSYFLGLGPGPLDCNAMALLDAGDVNDNEWITVADTLALLDSLFCATGPIIPPPLSCGPDPSNSQKGFDVVNPNYSAFATVTSTASSLSALLEISVPNMVQPKGATLALEFSSALTPQTTLFSPAPGVGTVYAQVVGKRVIVSVNSATACGSLPAPTPPFNRIQLGTVDFSHNGWVNCAPPPVVLRPDVTIAGGIVHRATIVDQRYDDHYPQLVPVTCTPVASNFIRGDVNADGATDAADAIALSDYVIGLGPGPLDCGASPLLDAGDANDNEWITVADVIYLLDSLFCSASTLPPPLACGPDPSDSQQGFDQVDPNYQVHVTVLATGASLHALLELSVPTTVRTMGATVVLEFSPSLTPQATLFSPDSGVTPVYGLVTGNRAVVAVSGFGCAPLPAPMPPGNRVYLGSVNFSHTGWAGCAPMPVTLRANAMTAGGFVHRATVVDQTFADHHPGLKAGVCMPYFIRGDANGDGQVDISDAISTLSHLFQTPFAPCEAALDHNDFGGLDIGDAIYLLGYLFVSGPQPPQPYPVCGPDRTVNVLPPLPCNKYVCP